MRALRVVAAGESPQHVERLALHLLSIAPSFPEAIAMRLWERAREHAHDAAVLRAYHSRRPAARVTPRPTGARASSPALARAATRRAFPPTA